MRTLSVLMLLIAASAAGCGRRKDSERGQERANRAEESPQARPSSPSKPPERISPPATKVVMPADIPADRPLSVVELDTLVKASADGSDVPDGSGTARHSWF